MITEKQISEMKRNAWGVLILNLLIGSWILLSANHDNYWWKLPMGSINLIAGVIAFVWILTIRRRMISMQAKYRFIYDPNPTAVQTPDPKHQVHVPAFPSIGYFRSRYWKDKGPN